MLASEIFQIISKWDKGKQQEFCLRLLSDLIMMNRVIINDSEFSLQAQIAILNRSNELAHKIWNVYREISENTGTNPIQRINSYCQEAVKITPDIKGHLEGIIKLTYSRFD